MPLLQTINLRKYFGEVKAVDGVALAFEGGTFTSIVGPNGAGKTTFINLLTGHFKPDSGRVIFNGLDVTKLSPHDRSKLGIARSFQLVSIFDEFSVLDNVRIAITSISGKSKRLFSAFEADGDVRRRAEGVLETFNLLDKKDLLARDLSHGDRKLLDVAMAFSLQPKLILLDEPTSGVSSVEKGPIMDILKRAISEWGLTAVIVEHDMGVVFKYSDRVVVMHQGKVLADDKPDIIRREEEVMDVLLGARE